MKEFFLTIEQLGDTLIERYIDSNGDERTREIQYKPTLFHHSQNNTKYKDIYGESCQKKSFDSMKEARNWIRRMEDIGQDAMGMDDFKLAYLSDTYPGEIQFDSSLVRQCNYDIEVTAPEFPKPNEAKYPIDALTHYDSVADKFYVFDLLNSPYGNVTEWDPVLAGKSEAEGGDEIPQDILDRIVYLPFNDEKELLLEYLNLWEQQTPVILTGWNVEGFDNPYVYNRLKNMFGEKTAKRLSPLRKVNSKIIADTFGDEREIITPMGISVLDYLDLYKKFSFTNQPSYRLDYVAEYELGVGKMEYDGPINKLRETDHQRYISYNIIDVARVQQIDKKRQFLNLSLDMAYYAKMQMQSVFSPIKTWDAIIFNSLKHDDKVIPQKKHHIPQSYPGAFVKEPIPNSYKYVMSADLTSLYPSIIRQVNVSPETLHSQFAVRPIHEYIAGTAPKPSEEYSCSPNGWMYRKDIDGVVPVEIKKVFDQRKLHKGFMLAAQRNMELIKEALHNPKSSNNPEPSLDYRFDMDESIKAQLHDLDESILKSMLDKATRTEVAGMTAQICRKLLINSLYGALGNVHFRYYDLRNATAITLFGQLALQWIERRVNEFYNETLKTENHKYVIYGDTDSIYMCVDPLIEKIGEDKFRDTNHLVDFLDKFAKEKLEPAIGRAFQDMCDYMNNKEQLMFMDREAIACPPLGSKGLGGFWTGKKRYALNVYDMEGTRYADPKMKIMGLETQKSSTPKACQKALKECIRRMLQEGEASLQDYYKEFEQEFRKQPYMTIAGVSSANNIAQYDDNGYPGYKCPFHIRGILTYNRAIKNIPDAEKIVEGSKVMVLPLRDQNPFGDKCIAWPSGTQIDIAIRDEVLKWLDYPTLFQKTFIKPLSGFTTAARINYEHIATLDDIFGW